jgi:hypothetical protein
MLQRIDRRAPATLHRGCLWNGIALQLRTGDSFEHVGEAVYASSVAAEAHAIQIAKELSEDHTWHGGWISVHDSRGNEFARVSIGIERTLTKSEAARRNSQQAIRKSNTLPRRRPTGHVDRLAATTRRREPQGFGICPTLHCRGIGANRPPRMGRC